MTVGVAFIGAASTLLGILYTQRSADAWERRERADRLKARKFELEQTERQAKTDLKRSLFDRRVAAHDSFLLATGEALNAAMASLGGDPDEVATSLKTASNGVYQGLTQIRMFGSDESIAAAESVMACVRDFNLHDRSASLAALRASAAVYRDAMRDDLGV